ncbi:hypothetical protein B6N60_04910 [Richelia sinica FACHB-800]|uniref:Uncharacterized protein n=1 Tax=Richelia sinica FACHB-800 TaxID=1357546 RepID=A0A975TCI2_9NOST|nr:hypothetical protein B6N60_04910 [Richelia sinica FACHB-800]
MKNLWWALPTLLRLQSFFFQSLPAKVWIENVYLTS